MKGQAEMLEWFPRLLMMLVAVIVIAMLVRYYAYRDVHSEDLERNTYMYRIYYDNYINLVGPTGRVYSGIIDFEKFSTINLDEKFGVHGKMASCLTLSAACIDDTIICHDKATYDRYLPFARFGTLGKGSATFQENIFPVTIRSDTECTGILNITIVRPNS